MSALLDEGECVPGPHTHNGFDGTKFECSNEFAPEGWIFVCCACGKLSRDRYGVQKVSRGWDESCMLNCSMFEESRLIYSDDGRRVIEVR